MGLDITAYSKLTFVCVPDDGYERSYDADVIQVWENPHFPGRLAGLYNKGLYLTSDSEAYGFPAGSYCGYGDWRDVLDQAREGLPSYAFEELIHFADNEGTIGPSISLKLHDDFVRYAEPVKAKVQELVPDAEDRAYWLERYEHWTKAFTLAADGGCVIFH
jgi:hypothetical protein